MLGVKPIAIVQVARCASPPGGQVVAPVAANSGSFEVTLPMNSEFAPVFLTVMFLVTVSPTGELPRASEVGIKADVHGSGVAVGVGVAGSRTYCCCRRSRRRGPCCRRCWRCGCGRRCSGWRR